MSTEDAVKELKRLKSKFRLGAKITNSKRTFAGRSKSSLKGWKLRKERLEREAGQ